MSDDTANILMSDFLDSHRNLILATNRADDTTQMTPVWFGWEDDTFIISTVKHTVKWKNWIESQFLYKLRKTPRHFVMLAQID